MNIHNVPPLRNFDYIPKQEYSKAKRKEQAAFNPTVVEMFLLPIASRRQLIGLVALH